ncbi:hypothetical protein [uncultured Bartonella sp.]|uniref:hypothetical protein n=1 Tax=uncultured Bartonella sp. TaxID=104108 RepID=UPI0025E7BEC7|nr:hypothetical protein [uncultured Bartonella sp.]
MSTQVQQLRGTTEENNAFTGKSGVLTVDTEKKDIRVHDGVKQGGYSIMDRVQQLQQDNRVFTGNVTINNTNKTTSISFIGQSNYSNPTIRMDRTKEAGNFCDLAFMGSSLNIYLNKFGDIAKFNVDGTTRFSNTINIQDKTYLQLDGNISGSRWDGGNLWQHIENRFNSCVIETRQSGWACANSGGGTLNGLPSGYFTNGIRGEPNGTITIGGAQLQIKVPNRGWCPMASW